MSLVPPTATLAQRLACLAGAMLAGGLSARAEFTVYPAPPGVTQSERYRVEIAQAGATSVVPVLLTVARQSSNRSKDTAWASFAFTERVKVKVTVLAGEFARCSRNTAEFELDRPGQFASEFDENIDHPLVVFADPPETDVPSREDPAVRWFGPGGHDLGEEFISRDPANR